MSAKPECENEGKLKSFFMQTQTTFPRWTLLVMTMLIFFSCGKDQDAWKTDLKASKEYAELKNLNLNESAELNNSLDKLLADQLKGKTAEEAKSIMEQSVKEIEQLQRELKTYSRSAPKAHQSRVEAEKESVALSIDLYENSSLSEPLKRMFVENIKAQSQDQVRRAELEEALLKKFPQLNGSLRKLLQVMQEE